MKLSPTQVVERGHHSLARRTSEVIDKIDRELQLPFASRAILLDCNATLAQIASNRSVISVGSVGSDRIHRAMVLLDHQIPPELKPDNPHGCLALASLVIRSHFSIPSFDELITRGNINHFLFNSDQSGLLEVRSSKNMSRILSVEFNPNRTAYSTIINVHELFHSLQPEHSRVIEIFEGMSSIDIFSILINAIYANSRLSKMQIDVSIKSNQLTFFSMPEVELLALSLGLDLTQLREYIRLYKDELLFLQCYSEGEAYLMQGDVIQKSSDLQRYPEVLRLYAAIALLDALISPFSVQRAKIYEVGVGIGEYLRNNPGEKEDIVSSLEFRATLAEIYFRNLI